MFEFLNAVKQAEKWCFKIKSFWITKSVVVESSISFSKTNKDKSNQKNYSSQPFISRSFLHRSKNVAFDFIVFHFSKKVQIDSRLQAFRAMRRSAFVVTIQNFFSRDLSELRETRRHQLFRRVEKNDSSDRSSSSSEQLIIEGLIEE